jgi:putative hemolysin
LESDLSVTFLIVCLVITFLLSSFFAVVKIVFNSVNNGQISADESYLKTYGERIENLLERQPQFDNIVTIGRVFSSTLFSITVFLLFRIIFPANHLYSITAISFAVSSAVLILFTNEIPRAFALRFYRGYLPYCYIIYRMISWFLLPFSALSHGLHKWLLSLLKYDKKFSFLTEQEQARIIEDTESLNEEEKEMIRSIFDFGETTVDQIMVPRIDIKGLESDCGLQAILKMIREEGHSRIPVYKDTIDSIAGILYSKDILSWLSENKADDFNLAGLLKKPHFVPAGKKVNDLMREFKKKHIHIAIVVDEYGGTAGLVTMEDILEEIVGDIQDEYDEEEREVIQLSETEYLIDPHTDIHDLNDDLNLKLDLENVDYNTLGGLIYHEYGDVPQENTWFEHNGIKITILKMDNQRIEKVKLELLKRSDSEQIENF